MKQKHLLLQRQPEAHAGPPPEKDVMHNHIHYHQQIVHAPVHSGSRSTSKESRSPSKEDDYSVHSSDEDEDKGSDIRDLPCSAVPVEPLRVEERRRIEEESEQ